MIPTLSITCPNYNIIIDLNIAIVYTKQMLIIFPTSSQCFGHFFLQNHG